MRNFSFEIVRRGFDRFSWVFVEVSNGRRRVLARANRDFRSKKRVKKAVDALKEAVAEADVIDATGDPDPFELPATSFELGPYALPLLVGSPSFESAAGRARRQRSRARRAEADENGDRSVEDTGEADESTPARTRKAATRKSSPRAARGAGKKTTRRAPARAAASR